MAVDPIALGDEVLSLGHAGVRTLVERVVAGQPTERIEREDLDRSVVVLARRVEQRLQPCLRSVHALGRVERREQAVAEPLLLAAAGIAMELRRLPSAARASAVRPSARSTRPRWTRPSAARRTSPVASALPIPSFSVAAPAS